MFYANIVFLSGFGIGIVNGIQINFSFIFQSRSELRSCPLRYEKRLTRVRRILLFHVIRLGFEPKTHSLEGCCSIQLSYRTEPYYLTWTGLELYDIVIVAASLLSKVDAKIEFILLNSK